MEKIIIPHQFQKGVGVNSSKFNQNFETIKEAINNVKDELDAKAEKSLNNLDKEGLERTIPIGTILMMPRTNPPEVSRLIYCNGAALSRTTYNKLFSVLGTYFGAGDGHSTFNLPDYRGKFLRCASGNSNNNIYLPQAQGLPNITGSFNRISTISGSETAGAFTVSGTSGNLSTNGIYQPTVHFSFSAARCSQIYGASQNVTPENYCVIFYIKY